MNNFIPHVMPGTPPNQASMLSMLMMAAATAKALLTTTTTNSVAGGRSYLYTVLRYDSTR